MTGNDNRSTAARAVAVDVDVSRAAEYIDRGWWRDRTILDDFHQHVAATPDKLAVVGHRAGAPVTEWTYGQLAEKVDAYAAALLDLGVRPGEVVSIQLPNWWQLTALHLATARIGAVTNAILPILRQREVAFICDRLASRVLVTAHTYRGFDYASMVDEVRAEVPTLEAVFAVNADEALTLPAGVRSFEAYFDDPVHAANHPRADLEKHRPEANQVAQIQFTSGTTGEPKGVVHTWNTVYAGMRPCVQAVGLTADDVALVFSPMAHTTGFYFGITMPACYGQTAVLQDVWDPSVALELADRYGATWTIAATPFIFDFCAAVEKSQRPATLTKMSSAGAPIPPVLVEKARTILGATLYSAWGMTEIGAVTSTLLSDPAGKAADSDGVAPDWVQLAVLDEDGAECPRGTIGRLVARGASLLVTYHKRPDLFHNAFTPDGWMDTGDLAWMDEAGYIRISGRTKDLVMRGGENIPVVEVEGLLLEHPAVDEVAVVGVPDERLGERAAAVVVPSDVGHPPSLADLTAFLAERRMAKHFWPESVVIVPELPRTATGKVQKFRVKELVIEPTS